MGAMAQHGGTLHAPRVYVACRGGDGAGRAARIRDVWGVLVCRE